MVAACCKRNRFHPSTSLQAWFPQEYRVDRNTHELGTQCCSHRVTFGGFSVRKQDNRFKTPLLSVSLEFIQRDIEGPFDVGSS